MIDKNQIKEQANQFYLAADGLISKDNLEKLLQFTSPYVVLLSFSIELYFKYIIYSTNGTIETEHDLKYLYNRIDSEAKKNIKIDNIEAILDENTDAFVDWRYIYEKFDIKFDVTRMKNIADKLYVYCNQ